MKEKTTVGWLADFAAPQKGTYAVSVLLAVMGVLCSLLPYFIIGTMVTELLDGNRDFNTYLKLCLWMAGCWILRILFHNISTTLSHKATFHVLAQIRERVCDKRYRLPLGYVTNIPSGSFKNIIVERIDSIETTLAHVLPEFTANLLGPLCIIVYLFILDWRMALISLITVPLGIIFYMGMMIGYEESFQNTIDKTRVLNDTAVEYINGIEVIKAFGKAESSYEKFVVAAKEGAACYIDWMRRCLLWQSAAMTIFPATLMTVLPLGGWLYSRGTLPASVFLLIIILSMGIVMPLITCSSYMDDLGKIGSIIGEVTEILSQEEMQRPETSKRQPANEDIELSDVTFGYREEEVLHGVNLRLRAGTVNALVGPSGSGKSTIAKLIAGLWDVKEGAIFIGGVDTRELSLRDQNRNIAYVAQDNYLFDLSVRENIRMGRPSATDAQVEQAARESGCYEFIMQLEHGFDTLAGGAGGHLSGGERQRISIARAIMKDAPVIILDEATANVDPENEKDLIAAIEALTKQKTIIMIAHRLKDAFSRVVLDIFIGF